MEDTVMNSIRFYNAFNPVHRSLINDLFNNFTREDSQDDKNCGCIPANVIENENEFLIELSVPGFSKEQIRISVEKNVLVVKAEKNEENERKYLSREFGLQSFERRFVLSKKVNADNISASFNNGILEVTLPRKAEVAEKAAVEVEIQ
jgi:HSP20 family protein